MPSIQDLREKRNDLAKQAREMIDNNTGSKWNDKLQNSYDEIVSAIDETDSEIGRIEKILDIESKNKQRIDERSSNQNISADEAHNQLNEESVIFLNFLRGGVEALTPEQRMFAREKARSISNVTSTTVGSQGGFLVPTEFAATLTETLATFGGMRSVAQVIQTDNGQSMDWPTTNAISEEGEIVGENASTSNLDPTFGTVALPTYKFSSKDVAVPFELLQDSAIDLVAHITNRLAMRIGRITNRMYTAGTGIAQPNGAVTASAAGKIGANGKTVTVDFDDLYDLIHSVDPAYRSDASLMFHDSTLKALKKLKDANNRPLWIPGLAVGEPDTIDSQAYVINQHMPAMSANAKSILFGDFNRYIIRDVMQVLLFRMEDSAYTKKGQVGFLSFFRSGGNLVDTGGALKHYQNSAL